ncbi:MAG: type III pantothenate kinase [Isosphaeraceae bacterium]
MIHVVADLGNTRLKWGRVGPGGWVEQVVALPADDPDAWSLAWDDWVRADQGPTSWAISSVNPPAAARLATFLGDRSVASVRWYRSAADVDVAQALAHPETTGADRALAVAAAVATRPRGRPGLVVLCGTAVTVERISAEGVWQGGAIGLGLGLSARALHTLTAQLPEVTPIEMPPAWGDATRPALEAGVYWGVVGAVRELLTRQSIGLGDSPWLVWSGGDAGALSRAISWPDAQVSPDLVLLGLARQAFSGTSHGQGHGV